MNDEYKIYEFNGSIVSFSNILENPSELEKYINIRKYIDDVKIEYVEQYELKNGTPTETIIIDYITMGKHKREIVEQFNVQANGNMYMVYGVKLHRYDNLMYFYIPFKL